MEVKSMEKKFDEMKGLIEEAQKYHAISVAQQSSEEEADAAYSEYWARLKKIADVLVEITGGKIDLNTGLKMAAQKKEEILAILKRAA